MFNIFWYRSDDSKQTMYSFKFFLILRTTFIAVKKLLRELFCKNARKLYFIFYISSRIQKLIHIVGNKSAAIPKNRRVSCYFNWTVHLFWDSCIKINCLWDSCISKNLTVWFGVANHSRFISRIVILGSLDYRLQI